MSATPASAAEQITPAAAEQITPAAAEQITPAAAEQITPAAEQITPAAELERIRIGPNSAWLLLHEDRAGPVARLKISGGLPRPY